VSAQGLTQSAKAYFGGSVPKWEPNPVDENMGLEDLSPAV
jgi:hypothetical protein